MTLSKKNIIVMYALLVILFSIASITVNSDVGCCTNPNVDASLICTDKLVDKTNECCPDKTIYTNTNGPKDKDECRNGKSGKLFFIPTYCDSVTECNNVGCCCPGGIMAQPSCVSGTFYERITDTAECSNRCGNPPPEAVQCRGDDFKNIKDKLVVEPIPPEKKFKLKWTDNCVTYAEKYGVRFCKDASCNVDYNTVCTLTTQKDIYGQSCVDDGTKGTEISFNVDRSYKLIVTYKDGITEESNIKTGNLGDEECLSRVKGEHFCLTGPGIEGGIPAVCIEKGGKLELQKKPDCEKDKLCYIKADGQADCRLRNERDDCDNIPDNPFGLFLANSDADKCEGTEANPRSCFYDESQTITGACYACKSGMECIDYKTQDTCARNNCKVGNKNCVWNSYTENGIQKGVCVNPAKSNCQWCNKAGTGASDNTNPQSPRHAYNELLDLECTKEKAEALSGSTPEKCIGSKECKNVACTDFSQSECTTNTCGVNSCKWIGGKCRKDINDDGADCKEGDFACERDYDAPETTLISDRDSGVRQLTIDITDKKTHGGSKSAILPDDKTYITYLCSALEGVSCTPSIATTERTLTISSNLPIGDKRRLRIFAGGKELLSLGDVDRGASQRYTLRYYSKDPAGNKEEDKSKTILVYATDRGPILLALQNNNDQEFVFKNNKLYLNNLVPTIKANFDSPIQSATSSLENLDDVKEPKKIPTISPSGGTASLAFTGLSEARYKFTLDAKNNLGLSMEKEWSCPQGGAAKKCPEEVIIDTTKPKLSFKFKDKSDGEKDLKTINKIEKDTIPGDSSKKLSTLSLILDFEEKNGITKESVAIKRTSGPAVSSPETAIDNNEDVKSKKDPAKTELKEDFEKIVGAAAGHIKFAYKIEALPDGDYTITINAKDFAGNEVDIKQFSFVLNAFPDTGPPIIEPLYPKDTIASRPVELIAKITDASGLDANSIKLKINGNDKILNDGNLKIEQISLNEIKVTYTIQQYDIIYIAKEDKRTQGLSKGHNLVYIEVADSSKAKNKKIKNDWTFVVDEDAVLPVSVKLLGISPDFDIKSSKIIDSANLAQIPSQPEIEIKFDKPIDEIEEITLTKTKSGGEASDTNLVLVPSGKSTGNTIFNYRLTPLPTSFNGKLVEGAYNLHINAKKLQEGKDIAGDKYYGFYIATTKAEIKEQGSTTAITEISLKEGELKTFAVSHPAFNTLGFEYKIEPTTTDCEITKSEARSFEVKANKPSKQPAECIVKIKPKEITHDSGSLKVIVDNTPPTISSVTPNDKATIAELYPEISAVIEDFGGVDSVSAELKINDEIRRLSVENLDRDKKVKISYKPDTSDNLFKSFEDSVSSANPAKPYSVSLSVKDIKGNGPSTKSWTFTINPAIINPTEVSISQSADVQGVDIIKSPSPLIRFKSLSIKITYPEPVYDSVVAINDARGNSVTDVPITAGTQKDGGKTWVYDRTLPRDVPDGIYKIAITSQKKSGDTVKGSQEFEFKVLTGRLSLDKTTIEVGKDTELMIQGTNNLLPKVKFEADAPCSIKSQDGTAKKFTITASQVPANGKCIIRVKEDTTNILLSTNEINVIGQFDMKVETIPDPNKRFAGVPITVKVVTSGNTEGITIAVTPKRGKVNFECGDGKPNTLVQCFITDTFTSSQLFDVTANKGNDEIKSLKDIGFEIIPIAVNTPPLVSINKLGGCEVGSKIDIICTATDNENNVKEVKFWVGTCTDATNCAETKTWVDSNGFNPTRIDGNKYIYNYQIPNSITANSVLISTCKATDTENAESRAWGDAYGLCVVNGNCDAPIFKITGLETLGLPKELRVRTYKLNFDYIPSITGKQLDGLPKVNLKYNKIIERNTDGTEKTTQDTKEQLTKVNEISAGKYQAEFDITNDFSDNKDLFITISGKEVRATDNCIGGAQVSFKITKTPLEDKTPPLISNLNPRDATPFGVVPLTVPFKISGTATDESEIKEIKMTVNGDDTNKIFTETKTYTGDRVNFEFIIPQEKLRKTTDLINPPAGKQKGQNDVKIEITDNSQQKNKQEKSWSFIINPDVLTPKSIKLIGRGKTEDLSSPKVIDKNSVQNYNVESYIEIVFEKNFDGSVDLNHNGAKVKTINGEGQTTVYLQINDVLTEGKYEVVVKNRDGTEIKKYNFKVVLSDATITTTPLSMKAEEGKSFSVAHPAIDKFKFDIKSGPCKINTARTADASTDASVFVEATAQGVCEVNIKDQDTLNPNWVTTFKVEIGPADRLSLSGISIAQGQNPKNNILYTQSRTPAIIVTFNKDIITAQISKAELASDLSGGAKHNSVRIEAIADRPNQAKIYFGSEADNIPEGPYTLNIYYTNNIVPKENSVISKIIIDSSPPSNIAVKAGKTQRLLSSDENAEVVLLNTDLDSDRNSGKSTIPIRIEVADVNNIDLTEVKVDGNEIKGTFMAVQGQKNVFAIDNTKGPLQLSEGSHILRVKVCDDALNCKIKLGEANPVDYADYKFAVNAFRPRTNLIAPKYGFVSSALGGSVSVAIETPDKESRCAYALDPDNALIETLRGTGVSRISGKLNEGDNLAKQHIKAFAFNDYNEHTLFVKCDESPADNEETADSGIFKIGLVSQEPLQIIKAEAKPNPVVEPNRGAKLIVETNRASICSYSSQNGLVGFDGYNERWPATFKTHNELSLDLSREQNGARNYPVTCKDKAEQSANSNIQLEINPAKYEPIETTPETFEYGKPILLSVKTNKDVICVFKREEPNPEIIYHVMSQAPRDESGYYAYNTDDLRGIIPENGGIKGLINPNILFRYEVKC